MRVQLLNYEISIIKTGTILTYANRRQLPEVPDDFKSSMDHISTGVNNIMPSAIDDDYAEIGPGRVSNNLN